LLNKEAAELILFHEPLPVGLAFHTMSRLDNRISDLRDPAVELRLLASEDMLSEDLIADRRLTDHYIVPLGNLQRTTQLLTVLADKTRNVDVYIVDSEVAHTDVTVLLGREVATCQRYKGDSPFGPSDYVHIHDFSNNCADPIIDKVGRAMRIVSDTVYRKLGAFEKALPIGFDSGKIWNLRKSIGTRYVLIDAEHDQAGECGFAYSGSGRSVHDIYINIDINMTQNSTDLGVALVIIHEIGHQFDIQHNHYLHNNSLEASLFAAQTDPIGTIPQGGWANYWTASQREIRGCR
jgi:hypothetical protein